jgi:hypothetical protein
MTPPMRYYCTPARHKLSYTCVNNIIKFICGQLGRKIALAETVKINIFEKRLDFIPVSILEVSSNIRISSLSNTM